MASRRRTLFALLLVFVLPLAAFWPGLSGGFLFDDYPNIVQQERVHLTRLDSDSILRAATAFSGPVGRPIAMASFAMDYYFSGLDPRGYKVTSLAIHSLNALLVFMLARILISLASPKPENSISAALPIALVWAVHPLQVSTVLYVVQRMETLAYFFVLLALLAYLRGRRMQIEGRAGWHWLSASALLASAGLLSKESAALFPAFTLAIEWSVLRFRADNRRTQQTLRVSYALAMVVAALAFTLYAIPRYAPAEAYAIRDFSMPERLLTQLRVLPMYISWILIPNPASYIFYYDNYAASKSLLDPRSTALGALLLTLLVAIAVKKVRANPLFSLGTAIFFVSHGLTSNIIPLELVFEHRNYFASFGIILATYALIKRMPRGEIRRLRTILASIIVVTLFGLTLIRSAGWGNTLQLALELTQLNPGSSRASTDLGEQYMIRAGSDPSSPFYKMAMEEFLRGSKIPGASPMPEQGLIVLAATAGEPIDPAWWDSAIQKLETRAIGPQELSMLTGFLAMREKGLMIDDRKFAEAYLVMVNRMTMPASQYYAFGIHALEHLGDEDLAAKLFERTVDHGAKNPSFIAALVESLYNHGHQRQARQMAEYAKSKARISVQLPDELPDAD